MSRFTKYIESNNVTIINPIDAENTVLTSPDCGGLVAECWECFVVDVDGNEWTAELPVHEVIDYINGDC